MRMLIEFACVIMIVFSSVIAFGQVEVRIVTESSEPVEQVYLDDLLPRTLVIEKQLLDYASLREADVPWQKRVWRVIDIREKVNLPFAYPEMHFFSILAKAAGDGAIKVFADEKFEDMLSSEEVSAILADTDTSDVIDPVTYEVHKKVTRSEINPTDIKRFRVKEIWYFNKETSRMQVRIMGIAPLLEVFDEDSGAFKYELPLFWTYFPEARVELSRHTVFNGHNDASVITWTDVFEMRQFSSYIYKQSNVHDVRLIDMFADNGVDRLLESEKISSELFNWEHDLWTY